MKVKMQSEHIDVIQGKHTIRIAARHAIYIRDIVTYFDYYFNSVVPVDGRVDFSKPAFHQVRGFDEFPIRFQSFSEPVETAHQYLAFAQLQPGAVVLDLGAYSGLTSILFAQAVGAQGRVIAVEADLENYESLVVNTQNISNIERLYAAIWNDSQIEIEFSSEGNMGAGAVEILGNRGNCKMVPTVTFAKLEKFFNLQRVDLIKCDVEGAEKYIFEDPEFFRRHQPRMIIETHYTDTQVIKAVEALGYEVRSVQQAGVRFPLLECVKP